MKPNPYQPPQFVDQRPPKRLPSVGVMLGLGLMTFAVPLAILLLLGFWYVSESLFYLFKPSF